MTVMASPMPPRDQALKRAIHQLVAAAGGCEQAALLCRLGKSHLAAAGSINEPDRWLPMDVLRELHAITHGHADQLAVLRLLAADVGQVLVPAVAAPIDPMASIAALAKESSDVIAALAGHVAGKAGNASLIMREAQELMMMAAGIHAAAAAIAKAN